MKRKDITVIRMKEYNPPTIDGDDIIHNYHDGFTNGYYGKSDNPLRCNHDHYQIWLQGQSDGLDATARPR